MLVNGSPSPRIPLNLQLFAEGDPTPIDPTPAPTDPTPNPTDPTPPQDPGPSDPPADPPQLPSLKVKFNHEEKEIPYEEAVQLAQKGMNYDRAVARAQQEARDAYIAEQGYEWQGKSITTEAEYKAAVREQELLNQYKELPPEVAQQLTKVDLLEQKLNSYERKEILFKQEKALADKPFFNEWKAEVQNVASQFNCDYSTAYALLAEEKMPEILASYDAKLKTAKDDAVKEYIAQKTKPQGTVEGTGITPVIEAQQPKSFADARKQSLELLNLAFKKE